MILVADNMRITDSSIQKAVKSMDAEPIKKMAAQLAAAGAGAIDINSGPLTIDPENRMRFLVSSVQEVTDLPVLLDSTNPKAIRAGLRENKKTAIINGFSLEPHKLEKILPLAEEFEADIIGYLLHPDSQPPADSQDRLRIAVELFQECEKSGIPVKRLIIDPVVAPILWGDGINRNKELLNVILDLSDVLGFPVRTIAGLSNLTSGVRDKEKKLILQEAYLSMLAASGLTMVLMDILNRPLVRMAKACNSFTSGRPFTVSEL